METFGLRRLILRAGMFLFFLSIFFSCIRLLLLRAL